MAWPLIKKKNLKKKKKKKKVLLFSCPSRQFYRARGNAYRYALLGSAAWMHVLMITHSIRACKLARTLGCKGCGTSLLYPDAPPVP